MSAMQVTRNPTKARISEVKARASEDIVMSFHYTNKTDELYITLTEGEQETAFPANCSLRTPSKYGRCFVSR